MVVVVRMMRRIEQVLHLQVTLFALEAQLVEPLLSDEHLLVALLDGVELDESTQLHLLALASLILLALLLLESELLLGCVHKKMDRMRKWPWLLLRLDAVNAFIII